MNADKNILLNKNELLILLYQTKVSGMLLPKALSETGGDKNELNTAMLSLIADKRLIPATANCYEMNNELKEIFNTLSGAKNELIILSKSDPRTKFIFYSSRDKAVLLSDDKIKKGLFCLGMIDLKRFITDLAEDSMMPADNVQGNSEVESKLNLEGNLQQLYDSPITAMIIEKFTRNKEAFDYRLYVTREKTGDCIIKQKETGLQTDLYRSKLFEQRVLEE